jgi:hypothetical protein
MKITLQKLIYLIAFISFTLTAKAQYSPVPDTLRYSIGLDGGAPNGSLGDSYKFLAGVSLQADFPMTERIYITANLGYNMLAANTNSPSNPQAIVGLVQPNLSYVPLKIGFKYLLIRSFYVQVEGGESLLLNKSAVYGLNSTGLVYAGQMGIIFRLKQKSYIDAGIRYEGTQSYYGDGGYNTFFGARVAYAFNLK